MTLPSLTRGVGWRDDFISVASWGAPTHSGTFTTDGDTATMTTAGDISGTLVNQTIPGSLSTDTYKYLLIRGRNINSATGLTVQPIYTDVTTDGFTISSTTTQVTTNVLKTGKTIQSLTIAVTDVTSGKSASVDFVYFFKETLTLPSVTRPIRMRKQRYLNKIQILQREGNIVQDLGSSSPEFDLSGSFITTSQYGADVWPQVLDGLILESSTVQADGNPTWQWFSSDLYQRKVLVMDAMVEDVPGRQRNTLNDYVLRLLQYDVISQTSAALGAVT